MMNFGIIIALYELTFVYKRGYSIIYQCAGSPCCRAAIELAACYAVNASGTSLPRPCLSLFKSPPSPPVSTFVKFTA